MIPVSVLFAALVVTVLAPILTPIFIDYLKQ